MDLDKLFVSSVLEKGKASLKEALDLGVASEILVGEGKSVFEFILDYYKGYGAVPDFDAVLLKTGVSLEPVSGESRFFVDEILNRSLFRRIQGLTKDLVSKLEDKEPKEALQILEDGVHTIRKERRDLSRLVGIGELSKEALEYYEKIKAGERGILTPWPSVNSATLGFWPEDLVLFVARIGVGKCIKADSTIVDPITGIPQTIEELYHSSLSEVTSWEKGEGMVVKRISVKHDTGSKKCFRFKLRTGRYVDVTADHPFLTPEGWKNAEDIKEGASVAIPSVMPFPVQPITADPDELDIIAGKKAVEKQFPDIVWRLGPEQLSRFLRIFWMCNGYVDGSVGVTLGSEKMIRQLQSLLLRFGIQSSVRHKKATCNGTKFDAWRLRIYSEFLPKFDAFIPLWDEKKKNIDRLLKKNKISVNVGYPVVTSKFRDEIISLAGEEKGRWTSKERNDLSNKVAERLERKSFSPKDMFSPKHLLDENQGFYSIQPRSFEAFCEEVGLADHKWIFASNLFWDRVESVTDVGEQKVYDLTVPQTNCFVANDVLVHNSWLEVLIGREAWAAGKKVLFVTTEMASMRIASRFLAVHYKLPYGDLTSGKLGEFAEEKLRKGVEELMSSTGFNMIGGFDFRTSTLALAVDEAEPDIVLVDGAYLLKSEGGSRTERAAAVFDDLKRMAKSTKVPFVVTTQFNRETKTNVASSVKAENIGLTDVAGWNGDLIFGLVQTDDMKADKRMMIKPLKVREGVCDDIECHWDFSTMNFSEIPSDGGFDDEFDTGISDIDETKLPVSSSVSDVAGLLGGDDEVPF